MCNDYRLKADMTSIIDDFAGLQIKIRFPEGAPNIEARDDIRITDVGPIVRTIEGERNAGDLVQRRWSWPQNRRPVYNFRSEGREFISNRCLIVADGFYEFTTSVDPRKKTSGRCSPGSLQGVITMALAELFVVHLAGARPDLRDGARRDFADI